MYQFKSIRNELTLLLSLALAVILIIISVIYIRNVSLETAERVEDGLLNSLNLQTLAIESFIGEHGEVVDTMVASPQLIDWFDNYSEREKDLSEDLEFPRIVQFFKNLQQRDESTKAVFFASASTGEYFDSANDRYSGDGTYFATKRPWWGEAVAMDRLFITQPEVDFVDKTIVSSVKRTVYNTSGELIGVAGVDILLSTIEQEIGSQLKYLGQGEAFIINRDGRVILFPADKDLVKVDTDIAEVDNLIDDASGFAQLKEQIQTNGEGLTEILWKGQKYLVAFDRISMESPYVDWVAGIIISNEVIAGPIRSSVQNSVIITLVILSIISLTIWLVCQRIVNPLKRVVAAMYNVAHGDGDLTLRIKVESDNEVGQFAHQFNIFIERIHKIIRLNKEAIDALFESAERVSVITNSTATKAEKQVGSTVMVATAAEQLSYSVNGVSANSSAASLSADEADTQVSKGVQVVEEAATSIQTLAKTIEKASQVVNKVNLDSSKIGEVLEVIRSIAAQTNLLALNAAIEAARAGEQGRGFAVVADEVRSLASRTQESTESIHQIIEELQTNASEAVSVMQDGETHALIGVEKTALVQRVLASTAEAIKEIKQQSTEIANSTGEQAKASEEITEQASSIRILSEETSVLITQVQSGTKHQQEEIHKLAELVGKFKI
jgi:methyl-accepting chemotaxis protein